MRVYLVRDFVEYVGENANIESHCTFNYALKIGDNSWIGGRVTILTGVHVGNGAVIGAGAIVTKDVSDYDIVAGNPAKTIKYRNGNKKK